MLIHKNFQERWYLYGNDRYLALDLLEKDIVSASSLAERAWLLKFLPSLGEFDLAHHWLSVKEPELLNEVSGRATLLRILQHRGVDNPWEAMVPNDRLDEFQEFCQYLAKSSFKVDIWLGGGLGDQLECLAEICDPLLTDWRERLHLILPNQSGKALSPLLCKYWPEWAPSYEFRGGNPSASNQNHWLSLMGWKYFLAIQSFRLNPAKLLIHKPQLTGAIALVCCWRSKVDKLEKHWAHLRSIPFVEIANLYSTLIPQASGKKIVIYDITSYSADEIETLRQYQPTLVLAKDQMDSFLDTADLVLKSTHVMTVDTALVHLASWLGVPTTLLLHQYHDERWRESELRQCTFPLGIVKQTAYNSWRNIIRALPELFFTDSPRGLV